MSIQTQPRDTSSATAWEWRAMGTAWLIHHGSGVSHELAVRAAEQVASDEQRWSRFLPDSELNRINQRAGVPIEPDPETFDLLLTARRMVDRTEGAFQPLIGEVLSAWGYADSLDRRAAGAAVSPSPQPVRGSLRVDQARRRVIVPPGTSLDLGGIAKSWSAARAGRILREASGPVLLDAGGDVIAVRDAHELTVEHTGELIRLEEGQGAATSGYGRRHWRNGDGRPASHLIDPTTGAPAAWAHATVVADDPVWADVLATSLVVNPALIAECDEACLIVTQSGQRRESPRWQEVQVA